MPRRCGRLAATKSAEMRELAARVVDSFRAKWSEKPDAVSIEPLYLRWSEAYMSHSYSYESYNRK